MRVWDVVWASYQIRKITGCACAGNAGNVSLAPRVSDPDIHHGTCVTHVPWYMPGSLTSGFLWRRWRGKRSQYSRRMRNSHFYVSGKRPIECLQRNSEMYIDCFNQYKENPGYFSWIKSYKKFCCGIDDQVVAVPTLRLKTHSQWKQESCPGLLNEYMFDKDTLGPSEYRSCPIVAQAI